MVLLPSFSTLFSKLARRVSTAENTPIMMRIPIVTPKRDNNVRVRISRKAENANLKLSPINLRNNMIYKTDKAAKSYTKNKKLNTAHKTAKPYSYYQNNFI